MRELGARAHRRRAQGQQTAAVRQTVASWPGPPGLSRSSSLSHGCWRGRLLRARAPPLCRSHGGAPQGVGEPPCRSARRSRGGCPSGRRSAATRPAGDQVGSRRLHGARRARGTSLCPGHILLFGHVNILFLSLLSKSLPIKGREAAHAEGRAGANTRAVHSVSASGWSWTLLTAGACGLQHTGDVLISRCASRLPSV